MKKIGAVVAAGVLVSVLLVAMNREAWFAQKVPSLPPPPAERIVFVHEEGLNLPPVGRLPSLQGAMKTNAALRTLVEQFAVRDDAYLFANYKQTDADIAAILLLWGGADLSDKSKSDEGIDARIDQFLRGVYDLGADDPVVNQARLGRSAWPRLFLHYKVRLMAQAQGGAAPFSQPLLSDVYRDRFMMDGDLSRDFFRAYGAFLRSQEAPKPFRDNLMIYIDRVYGSNFSDEEKNLIALLR